MNLEAKQSPTRDEARFAIVSVDTHLRRQGHVPSMCLWSKNRGWPQ
jgi:hypothetical protein